MPAFVIVIVRPMRPIIIKCAYVSSPLIMKTHYFYLLIAADVSYHVINLAQDARLSSGYKALKI